MPSLSSDDPSSDPKRWASCKTQAHKTMIASGWSSGVSKFEVVLKRRAMKLWRKQ